MDSSITAPGLPVVRAHLSLTLKTLAKESDLSLQFIHNMESGRQDCLTGTLRKLAGALCCTADDLLEVPTAARLAEIRAAYHQREADRAREEARAAS